MPSTLKDSTNRLLSIAMLVLLSSCYTVRVVSTGTPEPEPLNTSTDPLYRFKKVHVLDTVISLKLIEDKFHLTEKCNSGGFYSFEYRVSLGSALLGAVTFSKKRRVNIKYICLKESN